MNPQQQTSSPTFDVIGARQAGYSDDEIADFLAGENKFDAAAARKAGYSSAELIGHLTSQQPAPVPVARRGGTASESRAAIQTTYGRGMGGQAATDPRRVDLPEDTSGGALSAPALRQEARRQADPVVNPEFVSQLREDFGAMPEDQRLTTLREMAGGNDVYARAARVILRDVEGENRLASDAQANSPVLTEAVRNAPREPAKASNVQSKAPGVAMPETGPMVDPKSQDQAARTVADANTSPKASADRAELDARDFNAEAWAKEYPKLAALASGGGQIIGGLLNSVPTVMDFAARLIDKDVGRAPNAPGVDSILKTSRSLMPEIGRQEMGKAWDKGEFGGWLTTNLISQAPQMAGNVLAALYPPMRAAVLPAMGAQSAGQSFADGDSSMAAVLKGGAEVLGEKASLGAFDRLHAAVAKLPVPLQGQVLSTIGKQLAVRGGSVTAQFLTGAVEEAVTQVLQNGVDKFVEGKNTGLLDKVAESAVLGAFMEGPLGAVHAVKGVLPQGAGQQFARAFAEDTAVTEFQPGAIAGYAARANSPSFYSPNSVDPGQTARAPGDIGPSALVSTLPPGASPQTVASVTAAQASPVALSMESMPETPFTPDQVAALKQHADAVHAEEMTKLGVAAQQSALAPAMDATQGAGEGAAPQAPVAAGQRGQQSADPGSTITQGSLARAARTQVDQRTAAELGGKDQAKHAEGPVQHLPVKRDSQVPQSSAEAQTKQPASDAVPQPGSESAPPSHAAAPQSSADMQASASAKTQATERTRAFTSKGRAVAWLAQQRMTSTHQPVRDGHEWKVEPKPTSQASDAKPAGQPSLRQGQQAAPTSGQRAEAALHVEPGQAPAPATAPVIASSMSKAASNTDRSPAQMRGDLVGQVDAAIAAAHDDSHHDVQQYDREARSKPDRAKLQRQGLHGDALERRASAVQAEIDGRKAKVAERIGFVEFDVPGDGTFKVLNTRARLTEFKSKVMASPGFKATRTTDAAPEYPGAQRGSASAKAAVEAMIDEGDAQAAADYAAAKGLNPRELGLTPARLAKLEGVTPTADAETASPGAVDADVREAAEPAERQAQDQAGPKATTTSKAPASTADQTPAARAPGAEELAGAMPWELSQADFIKAVSFRNTGAVAYPWSAWWRDTQLEGSAEAFDHPDLGSTTTMGARFFKTRREAAGAAKQAHERAVRRAVAGGRLVPAAVRGEYTGLELEAAKPVAAKQVEEAVERPEALVSAAKPAVSDAAKRFAGRPLDVEMTGADGGTVVAHLADAGKLITDFDRRIEGLKQGAEPDPDDAADLAQRVADRVRAGIGIADAREASRAEMVGELQSERALIIGAAHAQNPGAAAGEAKAKKIEDFGEHLPGARKDAARAFADKLALAETLTVAEEPLSKSWPEPQYWSLLDDGADSYAVAFAHAARDAIPTKPSSAWKVKGWAANVTSLRDLTKKVLGGEITVEQLKAAIKAMPTFEREFSGAVDLYAQLGHQVSLKGITLQRHEYTFVDGKYHSPALARWVVEKKARATAFSNWPNELAKGDTKEAAIEAFRARHQMMVAAGAEVTTKAPTRFDIVAYRGKPGVTIGKKIGREFIALKHFDSTADARAYRTEHQAELEKLLAEAKQVPPERRAENLPRVGDDHRDGGDVTPEQFAEAFGFRGIQFGNYVEGGRRQRDLNNAYDALHDLAGVLGVAPRALSLNGSLGLAFGARGHGGKSAASAHFEPARVVINLTKGSGAGSLAHEWFHAVDNYFSRARNEPLGFMTQRPYARGAGVRPEMVAAFKHVMSTIGSTNLAKRSGELDKTRSKAYWATDLEMAARSFESYVIAKLQDQGAANDYLANIVSEAAYSKPGAYPYPTAAETPAIRAAFDHFFTAVQTRVDEAGNVAMFQRKPDAAEANALRALSENDELFALPKPAGTTLEAIASEVDPEIQVKKNSQTAGRTDYTLTMPDGNTARLVVREPSRFGPQVYGFDLVDGEMRNQVTQRPGDNADDMDPGKGDVWIDVSLLESGKGGGQVYAIASAFAYNTGRVFIGDPAGLSDEAMRRRPEQMLSSALKFGTTKHLAPHPRQLFGDKSLGIPPLQWVHGDDIGNIRRLVELNVKALQNAGLDDTSITFDTATGQYLDSNGQALGRDGIAAGVEAGLGRNALAGGSTLARGAVWRALLRQEGREGAAGGRRDGLLASLARIASDHGPATEGIFYSRAGHGNSAGLTTGIVRSIADEITAGWGNAPGITVLATMADAPQAVRRADEAQRAAGASGVPAAFFYGGRVYLVAGQMRDAAAVEEAVLHEALGHAGLRGVFGHDLGAVLDELAAGRPELVERKAREYGLDQNEPADRRLAAEEALAELAETEPQSSLVQRALAAIRAWLRKVMPGLHGLRLSDAEIITRFIEPARAHIIGGGTGQVEPSPAYKRSGQSAPFYSQLTRTLAAAPINTAKPEAWAQYLTSLTSKGVKADEITWSGVEDWLAMQEGKVSKQQVLAYLDENGVRVEETVLGRDGFDQVEVRFDQDHQGTGRGLWVVHAGAMDIEAFESRDEADSLAKMYRDDPDMRKAFNGTVHGLHQLPGAAGYRELLLTLPGDEQFESPHWDQPNVLAHARVNERKDAQGRRILMVEELQSDWAARVRQINDAGANGDSSHDDEFDRLLAPFTNKTEAWVGLALKSVARYAVNNDFDGIAFISGNQAHQRFGEFYTDSTTQGRAAMSSFYGEADGTVTDNDGKPTNKRAIVHTVTKAMLKKLGGSELVTMDLKGRGRSKLAQRGFYITPTMQQAVAAGLPLFARKDNGSSYGAFKNWLEANPERDYSKLHLANTEAKFDQPEVVPPGVQNVDTSAGSFRAWFDGSKVVDAAGNPLLVHGGRGARGRFSVAKTGPFGSGIYLSDDVARVGKAYSDEPIKPAYVALRNPFIYSGAKIEVPGGWRLGRNGVPESAAAGLIQAVMPESSAKQMIDRLRHGKAEFGDAIRKQLEAMGHDGLIVKYADSNDGATQYIAFKSDQVMAATSGDESSDREAQAVRFQRVPADFELREFGRAGQLIEVAQDRYNRWKQVIDDVRSQGGAITDENDFYKAEERYWGRVGTRLEAFHADLKDFVRAVAKDGLSLDDVAIFAVAQHAEERNEAVARKRKDMPDGGSGMTTDEADAILESARQAGLEPALKAHAATLRHWIQGTREVLRDGGLINERDYAGWVKAYEHYVPLRGIDGQRLDFGAGKTRYSKAGGFNVKGEEGHEAHGRYSQAKHIIETIVQDRARALVRVGKNDVLRSFAQFVIDNPSPNLWRVEAVEAKDATIDDEAGDRVLEDAPTFTDERTITLKDDGQEIRIQVLDDRLLRQLRHMDVEANPSWVVGALQWANRKLSHIYTTLSPTFTVVNGLRDVRAAMFGMVDEVGFMAAPKLLAKMPQALHEAWRAEAGAMSADYQLYASMGGQTHFFNLKTLDSQADELQRLIQDAERSPVDPRRLGRASLNLIEAINGGIENATRLAAFKVARESGKSTVQAASIAKNLTVNFNRKGTQQLASAWILFFNPAVQDLAMGTRRLANPKVLATIGTVMLGVAALAIRNAAMGDDDDGVAWWDKIPDDTKERNLIIMLPPGSKAGDAVPGSKTGRYIKVPMPYFFSFFPVLANQVVDVWRHGQDPKRGRDLLHGAIKSFNGLLGAVMPVPELGRAMSADSKEAAGKSLVLAAVPDALNPIAQNALNMSSFGRPLYPDGQRERHKPDSQAYFPGQAGTLFQRGAEGLNRITGGTKYQAGLVDLAPASLENLVRSYGGGPVGFALDLVNSLYARQSIARPDLDAKKLPFVKQFYAQIDAETDRLTGYQRLEAAEKIVDPLKRAQRDGSAEEVRAMLKDAGPMAGLGDAAHQTRVQLGQIIKAELAVVGNATMADDLKFVKLQMLAEQRRKVLQMFNAAYDRAIEATARRGDRAMGAML